MTGVPTIPTIEDPKLVDRVLLEMQTTLTSEISWLDHAFGACQVLKAYDENRVVKFPSVYAGEQRDYLKAFPDSEIGNFSFFKVHDGGKINSAENRSYSLNKILSLIVWFDFRKAYPADWKQRTVRHAKQEVMNVFHTQNFFKSTFFITDDYEEGDNIYKGFNHREIKDQYLMRPYGGFRLQGNLIFNYLDNC